MDFCSKYGQKHLITSVYLFDLFNLPSTKNESGIRELINFIDVAVRGLTQYGENTESWSVLLSYLLLSKLNYKTKSDFENTLTTKNIYPSYQSLCNFLKIQVANFTKRDLEKLGLDRKLTDKKSSLSNTTGKTKCCICQAPHLLIDCPQMIKKSPVERYKSVS